MSVPLAAGGLPISKSQIKLIHVLLGRFGIDDPTYREKLRLMFGVDSCKRLTRAQAGTLLSSLRRSPRSVAVLRKAAGGKVAYLVTENQRRLIGELRSEILWRVADGYTAWLKANQGIERIRTSAEASRAIRGLLGLKRHQEKGAVGAHAKAD